MNRAHHDPRTIYEIQVEGELDRGWEEFFSGLSITLTYASGRPPTTTLIGPVADQSALRGMLGKLWDLNLTLISVSRVKAGDKEENQNE